MSVRKGKDLKYTVGYIDLVLKAAAWYSRARVYWIHMHYELSRSHSLPRGRVEGKGEDSGKSLAEEQKLEKARGNWK